MGHDIKKVLPLPVINDLSLIVTRVTNYPYGIWTEGQFDDTTDKYVTKA